MWREVKGVDIYIYTLAMGVVGAIRSLVSLMTSLLTSLHQAREEELHQFRHWDGGEMPREGLKPRPFEAFPGAEPDPERPVPTGDALLTAQLHTAARGDLGDPGAVVGPIVQESTGRAAVRQALKAFGLKRSKPFHSCF